VDEKLFRLMQEFSCHFAATRPPDLDTLVLAYMHRAYELGKDAGRAEPGRDRTDTNYKWGSDGNQNGGESGPDL
jgi:hypothetical protein